MKLCISTILNENIKKPIFQIQLKSKLYDDTKSNFFKPELAINLFINYFGTPNLFPDFEILCYSFVHEQTIDVVFRSVYIYHTRMCNNVQKAVVKIKSLWLPRNYKSTNLYIPSHFHT